MTADVTHPQARHFLLARKHVGVLRFTQTIVQTGHKQRIGRIAVCQIAAKFRAILVLAFRWCGWGNRLLRRDHRVNGRIYRVHWVNRWIYGVDRWVYRINGLDQAGQKPVFTFLHNVIVIAPRHDTAGLLKRPLRVAANADNFNPFYGLRAGTANVVHFHPGMTGGVAFNDQFVRFRSVVKQHGIENQLAAVADKVILDGQRLPRRVLCMLEINRAARIQRQAGQRGAVAQIPDGIIHRQCDSTGTRGVALNEGRSVPQGVVIHSQRNGTVLCRKRAGGRDAACGKDIAVEDELASCGRINHPAVTGVQGIATAVALACGGNGCTTRERYHAARPGIHPVRRLRGAAGFLAAVYRNGDVISQIHRTGVRVDAMRTGTVGRNGGAFIKGDG